MMKHIHLKKSNYATLFLILSVLLLGALNSINANATAGTAGAFDSQNPSSALADSQVTISFKSLTSSADYIVVITGAWTNNETFSTGSGQTTGQVTFTPTAAGTLTLTLYGYASGVASGSALGTYLFTVTSPDSGNLILNNITIIVLLFLALIALSWLGSKKI